MAQVDSENSTAVPTKPIAEAPESPADALYFPTDITPEELFEEIGRVRREARDAIKQLIDLLDRTDAFYDEREHAVDEDPCDADDDSESSLGFLENHPTVWNGDGRDVSGTQVRPCAGLGGDAEDQHDGREPGEDDEPSVGYDVEPAEQDTGNDEPSLGWTEAFAQGLGQAGPPIEYEVSPPVITEAARARYKQSARYVVNPDGRHVDSECGLTGPSRAESATYRTASERCFGRRPTGAGRASERRRPAARRHDPARKVSPGTRRNRRIRGTQMTKTKAEALQILTAPGGPCDPFSEGVKDPEMMQQIIKESLDSFVQQNPQPAAQSSEQLAEAFLHFMAERKGSR